MAIFGGLRERFRRRKKREQTAVGLDFYLKIEGIEGESQDKAHAKEIPVLDFFFKAINQGLSAVGRGGGKVSFDDVAFVAEVDKSLIGALQACSTGNHIKTAVFTARKAGGKQQDYMKWTFSDFIVSHVMVQQGIDSRVLVYFSLNFSKVDFEYKEQKADGSLGAPISASYDLRTKK